MRGVPVDDLRARFHAVDDAVPFMAESPDRPRPAADLAGDMRQARPEVTRLLALADARGSRSRTRSSGRSCARWAARREWDAAEHLLDEWAQSAERELLVAPLYDKSRAALAAGRGLPEDTGTWAEKAIAVGEATGRVWEPLEARLARGTVALLAHEPANALEDLRAIWEHTQREDRRPRRPPGRARAGGGAGGGRRPRRGARGTHRLRELAERQEHLGLATARRCSPSSALASGDHDESDATAMTDAAAAYEGSGKFDRARTLLALGRAQRRLKQWRGARESLEQAISAFDALGSPGWAAEARAQLARVGGRRPGRTTASPRASSASPSWRPAALQQGDRAHAVRDRPHGRGAPLARVREARRPLAHSSWWAASPRDYSPAPRSARARAARRAASPW